MMELTVSRRNLKSACPVGTGYTVFRARRVILVPPICNVANASYRVALGLYEDHAAIPIFL